LLQAGLALLGSDSTAPEQIVTALPEAIRVLTSPAETGAVTLALPQDVQAEAYDYPRRCSSRASGRSRARARIAIASRSGARRSAGARGRSSSPAAACCTAKRPMRCGASSTPPASRRRNAGGQGRAARSASAVLGGIGATGTRAANALARDADLVIVDRIAAQRLHDRVEDRVSARARPLHRDQRRRDRRRQARGDAARRRRAGVLEELLRASRATDCRTRTRGLSGSTRPSGSARPIGLFAGTGAAVLSQAEVIGAVNAALGPRDVIVCAAGSLPGDLHKLWRSRDPKSYHLEYGYSCMGYEIAGGLGVKMAAPDREVVCAGRRRFVSDDGAGARHRRAGGTSRSRSSCSTTTAFQHRRPVAVGRLRRVRH
jgi:3D-(3,5/4)-trihydroxycyclohexane-1,2-dione acylhydrolase (decyclizing)